MLPLLSQDQPEKWCFCTGFCLCPHYILFYFVCFKCGVIVVKVSSFVIVFFCLIVFHLCLLISFCLIDTSCVSPFSSVTDCRVSGPDIFKFPQWLICFTPILAILLLLGWSMKPKKGHQMCILKCVLCYFSDRWITLLLIWTQDVQSCTSQPSRCVTQTTLIQQFINFIEFITIYICHLPLY